MYVAAGADRARWCVKWIAKGRVIEKDFGPDFADALALYLKAVQAGKKAATLQSRNMSFPPPQRLQPHTKTVITRNERGKRVRTEVEVEPMNELNIRGAWWCPYCIQLRKFVRRKGFQVGKIWMNETHYACPVCGVRHSDSTVRRWNPLAHRMPADLRRRVSRSRTTPTRRKRRK